MYIGSSLLLSFRIVQAASTGPTTFLYPGGHLGQKTVLYSILRISFCFCDSLLYINVLVMTEAIVDAFFSIVGTATTCLLCARCKEKLKIKHLLFFVHVFLGNNYNSNQLNAVMNLTRYLKLQIQIYWFFFH